MSTPARHTAVSPAVASSGSPTLATLFPGPAGSQSGEARAYLLLQGAVQPQEFERCRGGWQMLWGQGPRATQQGLEEEGVVELHQLTT